MSDLGPDLGPDLAPDLTFPLPPGGGGPATLYSLSLSASSGIVGAPVTLTYVADGTTSAVVTPGNPGVSGVYSPATVTLNGTTPVTQTWTPSATGAATFSPTNSAALTNPGAHTYSITSAPVAAGVFPAYMIDAPGGTTWTGTPFSMVGGSPAALTRQLLFSPTVAFLYITGNGNVGPYQVTDGTNIYTLPILLESSPTGGLVVIGISAGGVA
ncbi:MAG: hypothetical protein JWN14_2444 [Chthonomonadales bacterium]|nr:hypothetical protein [Chthonomonadales bacterium]